MLVTSPLSPVLVISPCHQSLSPVPCHQSTTDWFASCLQQFGGYGRYSGTQQEAADANGDVSPTSSKQPHLSRELRCLFEHSVSMPDGHKVGQTAASGRARAHSLPEGKQGGAEDAKHGYVLAATVPPYLPEGLAAWGGCAVWAPGQCRVLRCNRVVLHHSG